MSYTLKDRTNEFRACVESASLRASASNEARRPLLNNRDDKKGQRSEFARMAAKIGKDIQGTTFKLEKLAQRECPLTSRGLRYSADGLATRLQWPRGKRCSTIVQSRSA
jgi:hypothetical protein